jgi:hypothetical protein
MSLRSTLAWALPSVVIRKTWRNRLVYELAGRWGSGGGSDWRGSRLSALGVGCGQNFTVHRFETHKPKLRPQHGQPTATAEVRGASCMAHVLLMDDGLRRPKAQGRRAGCGCGRGARGAPAFGSRAQGPWRTTMAATTSYLMYNVISPISAPAAGPFPPQISPEGIARVPPTQLEQLGPAPAVEPPRGGLTKKCSTKTNHRGPGAEQAFGWL